MAKSAEVTTKGPTTTIALLYEFRSPCYKSFAGSIFGSQRKIVVQLFMPVKRELEDIHRFRKEENSNDPRRASFLRQENRSNS